MKISSLVLVALLLFPAAASAATTSTTGAVQDDVALRASIQAALLSDPRTDSLPPDQLNALITALAADATAHNIKPADISYIPRMPAAEFGAAAMTDTAGCDVWCTFSTAYGLDRIDSTIPVLFIISAGLLVMIFRRALRPQHHEHFTGLPHPDAPTVSMPPMAPPASAAPAPLSSMTTETPKSPAQPSV